MSNQSQARVRKPAFPVSPFKTRLARRYVVKWATTCKVAFRPSKFGHDFQSTVQTTQPAKRYYYMAPLARVHSRYHSHKPCRCGLRYWSLRWSLLHSALRMQTRFDTAGLHLLQPMLVLHHHACMQTRGLFNRLLGRTHAANLTGT